MTHRRFLFSLTIFSLLFIFIITPFSTRAAFKIGAPLTTVKNGLVGHWTFDGKDTNWNTKKTNDLSGNGKHGTITNMSTTTSPVAGRLGQGFHFDGVNDYITMGDINQSAYTVALWVKPDREINASISDGGSGGDVISFDDGYVGIGLGSQTGAFANEIITVLASLPDDPRSAWTSTTDHISPEWHHITAVWNASTGFYDIYFDGVKKNNITSGSSPGVLDIAELIIGAQQDPEGALAYFKGSIDDVRIYSRAISATEVSRLYRHGSRIKQNTSFPLGTLADGLVGHWTFDGKDTNWGTQKTNDRTSNANHGTMTNMSTSTSPTPGRMGQGLRFDGSNDYVNVLDAPVLETTEKTLSAWVKVTQGGLAVAQMIIVHGDPVNAPYAFELDVDSNLKPRFFQANEAGTAVTTIDGSNDPLVVGRWYHIVATNDLTTARLYVNGVEVATDATPLTDAEDSVSTDITIGGTKTTPLRPFAGSIDDVRIYNRALSATEVTRLYRQGAMTRTSATPPSIQGGLVGHWTFDGKDTNWGTNKTNDRSGNGNHGTITNMSTSSSPTPGRLGQAFLFDGSNDAVSIGNISETNVGTGPVSVSAWAYFTAVSSPTPLFNTGTGVTPFNGFELGANVVSGDFVARFLVDHPATTIVNSTTVLTFNRWYHLVGVRDGGNIYIYLDGVLENTNTGVGAYNLNNAVADEIGRRADGFFFPGKIDDVRIYSRALSAGEIKALYNIGR